MSNDGSLDIVKLRLAPRFDVPFSIWSEAHLIITPAVVVPTVHATRADKAPIMTVVVRYATSHSNSSSKGAAVLGGVGRGKEDVIAYMESPVIIPAIRKGKKNCKNLER